MENDEAAPKDVVEKAIKDILRELSRGNVREIAQTIYGTVYAHHRTAQQLFWSAMLLAQIEYATDPYDGRNEAAVILANRVKEAAVKLNYDLGLPYI